MASEPSQHPASEEQRQRRKRFLIGSQREDSPRILSPRRPPPLNEDSAPPETADPPGEADAQGTPPRNEGDAPAPPSSDSPPQAAPPPAAPAPELSAPYAPPQPAAPADAPASDSPAADKPPAAAAPAPPPATDTPAAHEPSAELPAPPAEFSPAGSRPRRVELPGDLEAEVDAVLGGHSIEQMFAEETAKVSEPELDQDTRRRGIVQTTHKENVFFSLGARHEGVASVRLFKTPPQPGDQMDVIVARFNHDDGLYELTIPGASVDVADWSDLAEGATVEARISGSNTGGLECVVNNIRGFIPASQIALHRVENFGEFVGQKLLCVVTEASERRRNLVLSHRAVLEREQEQARQERLAQLEVGQIHSGTVRSLKDFGAFVDLGNGLDGLIHISKMSYDRIEHPREVFQEGQQVQVKIERIDPQSGKIGLSYKDLLEDPWEKVEQKYTVGSIVRGPVSRVANFGAFVKLEPGVEGLIHVSELAHHHVSRVESIVQEGQEVEAKILSVDLAAQRIALSLKATQQPPAAAEKKRPEEEPVDEPPRESVVPKRKKPLRGGKTRSAGGDTFGLNW